MWTTALVPTDVRDPATGDLLYVYAKMRPRWYWQLMRLHLFASIVWRRYETARISWSVAWDIATGVYQQQLSWQVKP